MSWLTKLVRPKIRALVSKNTESTDTLWTQCPKCEQMIFHRDLVKNLHVCQHCGYHMRINVVDRFSMMFDNGEFTYIEFPQKTSDPLKFRDSKKYADRLKDYRKRTGCEDALIAAHGMINGKKVMIAAFNFSFMGGSMGLVVGEGLIRAAEEAVKMKAAFLTIPASGGARMQEGCLSLMQLPRSIIAVEMIREARLPYLVLLTDPTTGGVSASFAMLGDIAISEPGATIGFSGKRVIEQTIRGQLPEGFQTAEFLLEHGMIDMVVHRAELKERISGIIDLVQNPKKN